ncbi:MAG: fasciclin domain-containing protein [Burkholderiales bacterium]|nr:MAG: fasciclin domain-containing protein [Burkholderiales bacterium]
MTTATTSTPTPATTTSTLHNIVETAVAAGNFTTLVTAVKAAGLVETLSGAGPFTVFAPTDEAFAKVPKEALEALLKDKDALSKTLTYHVVAGKVMAADIKAGAVKTVQGSDVMLATEGGVTVGGAKVVAADVQTSNGVIHAIDTVLFVK